MVSVIVPIYNVEEYMDRCLSSIVNQTYQDLEIIVINDGSTDGSWEKCLSWQASDNRIRLHTKENEGLAATRNLGIKMSSGKYILFVDSDDWLELNAVEKLVDAAERNGVDIVYMNFYYTDIREDGSIAERPFIRRYDFTGVSDVRRSPEIFFDMDARMWSKLYRKSLWTDHGIEMPNHPYEDFPVMPLLVVYARSVCYLPDVLYHYYYTRAGSLINVASNKVYVRQGLEELYNAFVDRGLLDIYREQIEGYCIGMAKFAANDVKRDFMFSPEYDAYAALFTDFVVRYLPSRQTELTRRIFIWGSYSLRLIGQKMVFLFKNIKDHYMFSSIISIMCEKKTVLEFRHPNDFRQDMLEKDFNKTFHFDTLPDVNYVIVDLLEEINDIICYEGGYLTRSEALEDTGFLEHKQYDIIKFGSDDHYRLWTKACDQFVDILARRYGGKKIILVENYLCERYGTIIEDVQDFSDVESIRKSNLVLKKYYRYFASRNKDIAVVTNDNTKFEYTYTHTKYGCLPVYYNGFYDNNIRKAIGKIL